MLTEFVTYKLESGYSFHFKVKGNKKEYSQRVKISEGEVIFWSCDCIWGSIGRFQEKYILQNKYCKHLIECLKLLDYLGYLKKWKKENT